MQASVSQAVSQTVSNSLYVSLPRLQIYLQNPEQYTAFHKFLAKEFAVESLLYWKDVQTIKNYLINQRAPTTTDMNESLPGHIVSINLTSEGSCIPSSNVTVYQMLQLVCKMYIVDNAPQAINISFIHRNEILQKCSELSPQTVITWQEVDAIFKTASREILGMLESDSFLRFVKSEHFITPQEPATTGAEEPSPREVSTIPEPSPSGLSENDLLVRSFSGYDPQEMAENKHSKSSLHAISLPDLEEETAPTS